MGAGGKTTLMFALAKELAKEEEKKGNLVITTTTTKILAPNFDESPLFLVSSDKDGIAEFLEEKRKGFAHVTLVYGKEKNEGKLIGFPPSFIPFLIDLPFVRYLLIEADGSKRLPLKAPSSYEPVIPDESTLIVPLCGIEALEARLTAREVFRPEIFSMLTGLPLESPITVEAVAKIFVHPEGLCKGSPPLARIVPFINKVEEESLLKARELASEILKRGYPRIKKVILGRAKSIAPVIEILAFEPTLPGIN